MLTQLIDGLFVRNAVLLNLTARDLAAMPPYLEAVALTERLVLHERGTPAQHVYFIEAGVVS